MKKLTVSLLTAALFGLSAMAAPVTAERAKTTATSFFSSELGLNATAKEIVAQTDEYYIINMRPQGWAIVAADDVAEPILGYNPSSSISWMTTPSNMRGLLSNYSAEINNLRRTPGVRSSQAWARLTTPRRMAASRAGDDGSIEPLIKVHFDQPAPFNKYCPKNGSGQALVGCVAVAMSQAMTVQQYPPQPKGSIAYNCTGFGRITAELDAENPYNWTYIMNPQQDGYNEAARLLYHAGISVDMGYGLDGSGIPSNRVDLIADGLVDHFSYSKRDIQYFWRNGYQGDWTSMLINELSAGRAIVYNAIDSKGGYGHSFNLDGYDGRGKFHVNWGWGGSADGYFTINNLGDSYMGMLYDSGHVAVVGIGSPDRELRSIELSEYVIDAGLPAGTVVGLITVNGEKPKTKYKLSLRGAYNSTTGKFEEVPFEIKDDMLVTKEALTSREDPLQVSIIASITGANAETLTSTFPITICPLRTLGQATQMTYNRADGSFLIKTRNNTSYTLTGANATVIAQGNLSPVPHIEFNRSQLSDGVNVLTITAGSETKTIRIIK